MLPWDVPAGVGVHQVRGELFPQTTTPSTPRRFCICRESGLSRMARNHIHFVESFDSHADSGAISGLRGNCQVLVFIDVPLAMAHGISFYRATNGVVLSVGDPAAPDGNLHPAFFLRVEDAKTHSPLAGWSRPALPSWHAAATAAQTAAGAGAAGEGSTPAAATSAEEGAAAVAAGTEQVPAHSSYVGHAPMPAGPPAGAPKSPFRYAIVLDFEATCEDSASGRPAPSPQEIIEFPSVVVDLQSGGLVSEFQAYVRPTHHPALTPFCTELTGISQKVTDAADTFPGVLQRWAAWVEGQGLDAVGAGGRPIACLVTCGDWDLRKCLPAQAKAVDPPIDLYFGEGLPTHLFSRWINLKTAFKAAYGSAPRGMVGMLEELGLPLTGRHHSGIDDCRNLAAIVLRMLQDGHGAALRPTTVAPAVTRAAKGGGAPSAWGK